MAFSGLGSGTEADPYQITTIAQYLEMSNSSVGLYYKLMNDLDFTAETSIYISLYSNFDGDNHKLLLPLPTTNNNFFTSLNSGSAISNITYEYEGTILRNSSNNYYLFSIVLATTAVVSMTNITVINHLIFGSISFRYYANKNWGTGVTINGLTIDGAFGDFFGSSIYANITNLKILSTYTNYICSDFYGTLENFQFYFPIGYSATSTRLSIFGRLYAGASIKKGRIHMKNVYYSGITTDRSGILLSDIDRGAGNYIFEDVICICDNFYSTGYYRNAVSAVISEAKTYSGSISLKNILFIGNIDTPNSPNKNSRTEIMDVSHVITNSYYDKDKLTGLNDADYTGQIGLTSAQILEQSNFVDWDFVNVWEMTASGPTLRDVPEHTFVNVRDYDVHLSGVLRISQSSFSFNIRYSDTTTTFIVEVWDGETLVYTDNRSGVYAETITVPITHTADTEYKVMVAVMISSVKTYIKAYCYLHYYNDSAVTETNITCSSLQTLNNGTDAGRYIHGSLIYNGFLYGSSRVASSSSYHGTIVKASTIDVTNYILTRITDSSNRKYWNFDSMVRIGQYLYTFGASADDSISVLVKYDLQTDEYQLFRVPRTTNGSPSCTDGEFIYLFRSGFIEKINPSVFISENKENLDSVLIYACERYLKTLHYEGADVVHSMCVDGQYLYAGFRDGTNTGAGELQKIDKATMTLISYCAVPQMTDDMTQNLTHVFLGIEHRTPENVTNYGYGWGAAAIRKSDMNVTALPKFHKTDTIPTNSYASLIFGHYLIDCKTNKYIYAINISDVDNWSINENIGARTLKTYKILQTNGITQVNHPVNELLLVNSSGLFTAFLWNSISQAVTFTLTGLSFVSEPTITSISATVHDQVQVDLLGYILNEGGYSVSECGFIVGLTSDLSDGVIYICDDIETNFHKTIELLEPDIYYWRAYAINQAGTGYGAIESFIIEELLSPSTETISVTNRTISSAKINAAVTDLGSTSVIDHGVCYSDTNSIPTLNDTVVSLGSINSIGNFYADLINLIENTRYYVCSYAINSVGVNYGNVLDFWTITKPGIPENISSELIIEVQITFSIPSNLGNGTFLGFKIESKVLNGDWEVLQSLWTETTYACFITGKCWFRFTTITVEYGEGDATEEIEIRTGTDSYPYRIYLGSNEIIIQ